jgi:hypothetical protein
MPGHVQPEQSVIFTGIRTRLERAAAGLSLGEYIRQRVFDESVPKRRTRGKHPVRDYEVLGQLLGALGRSHMANNLNQLARAANCDSLVMTPENRAILLEACADIRMMREMLVRALGLEG